ncbi:DEAD/DEAH box helicase family protein [Mycoplasma todarodis]|uniref:DEAD/DEAH box helicase family protein n=1 Tax=Mycoplasma todarodis TaxID=1937191 RepID=UPI003B29A598
MKNIKYKILFHHMNGSKISFDKKELEKLNNFFTTENYEYSEKRSVLSVLLKCEHNILKENIEFWKDFISFKLKDVNRTFETRNPWLNIANILNKTTKKVDGSQLNFEQEKAFDALLNNKNKVVHVSAGTGSGKTWLSWLAVKELANKYEKFCALHITINESLEEQLITRYRDNKEGIFVGNRISSFKKQYIIGTQEKIFALIGNMIENGVFPGVIIVDEAHYANNDELRGKFYKFVINKLDEEFNARFWILSPFLKNIDDIFNEKQENYIKVKINSFESNKTFLKIKDGEPCLIAKNKEDFSIDTRYKDTTGMTLKYFSSKDKIYSTAIKETKKIDGNQEADIIEYINNQPTSWRFAGYYVVELLKKGVGVYHSSMPQNVKSWLFELVERNLITTIYATHAIANGIDFSFENIEMHTLKSGRQGRGIMNVNLFNNLTGRSGRYNKEDGLFKKSLITFIEPDLVEERWIEKHRDKFYGFQAQIPNETKDKIIDGNLKMFETKKEENEQQARLYLIDPRIDCRITKKITENPEVFKELNNVLRCIFEYIESTDGIFPGVYSEEQDPETGFKPIKDDIVRLFSNLNKFYKIQKQNSINETVYSYKKIYGNTLKSFYYNNEDAVYTAWWFSINKRSKDDFVSWGWMNENSTESEKKAVINNRFEQYIAMFRKEVKFKMSTMINHAILLNNELAKINDLQRFVTLNDIKKYKIHDYGLLKALKNKKGSLELLGFWVSSDEYGSFFDKKTITKNTYEFILDEIIRKIRRKGGPKVESSMEEVEIIKKCIKEFYERKE